MSAQGRRTATSLDIERRLLEEGYRFDFFQAVRTLERLYPQRQAVGAPDGCDSNLDPEVVRFRVHPSMNFPPSAIHAISKPYGDDGPVEMIVSFMGLTGPLGVLPHHYTALLLAREHIKDSGLRDFLDLFNHRLISLFYRAWEKYYFPVAYERAGRKASAEERDRTDRFAGYILSLIGLEASHLITRLGIEKHVLVFNAGLLAPRVRSAVALEGLLRSYFGLPVQVSQFTGRRLPISAQTQTRIGPGGMNHRLSEVVVGRHFWDPNAKFTVEVGPLSYAEYCEFRPFEPQGRGLQPLLRLVRFFTGDELDFDVRLDLKIAEAPRFRLGGPNHRGSQLGWSAWLMPEMLTRDPHAVIFSSDQLQSTDREQQEGRGGSLPREEI
jgi:type VI secretion system protein ImpH